MNDLDIQLQKMKHFTNGQSLLRDFKTELSFIEAHFNYDQRYECSKDIRDMFYAVSNILSNIDHMVSVEDGVYHLMTDLKKKSA